MRKTVNIITVALVLLVASFASNAQEISSNGTPANKKYGFVVGYLGYRFINPGFQLGIEKYVATTKNYQVITSLNLYYYNQPNAQSAIGINARIGQRFNTRFGLFLESYLGVGLQNTSYISTTYEYKAGLGTATENKSSKVGLSPGVVLGLGYDLSKVTKYPAKFYVRPAAYWLYPDQNLVFQTSFAVETGLIYIPTWKK